MQSFKHLFGALEKLTWSYGFQRDKEETEPDGSLDAENVCGLDGRFLAAQVTLSVEL